MIKHWSEIARYSPLAILTDLDGTLIPFAATPGDARPDAELLELLARLAVTPGVVPAIVSGRKREELDAMFPGLPGVRLVAEHGGWRRTETGWHAQAHTDATGALDVLAGQFDRLAGRFPGALVERKTWTITLHRRRVAAKERPALHELSAETIARWLAEHPGYEQLDGAEVVEVRPSWLRKSSAVQWLRERAGPRARLLAFGDDRTDEDVFVALGIADEGICVGRRAPHETAARWSLAEPGELVEFLAWLVAVRLDGETPLRRPPERITLQRAVDRTQAPEFDLLALSNRLPGLRAPAAPGGERRSVGGLVAALEPALAVRRGLWLGWSGRIAPGDAVTAARLDDEQQPAIAWIDLPETLHERYYNGFCNRVLWPLLHTFPNRVEFSDGEWEAYRTVNDAFAANALELVGPDTPVWVHDYHLLLVAGAMRRRGHRAPMGLFLHVPFPGPDVFHVLPWAEQVLEGMLEFDLIGFHTDGYLGNFRASAALFPGVGESADALVHRGRRIALRTFPIGIIPAAFQEQPDACTADEVAALLDAITPGRLILGVDRLDYTKGIPERLHAFAAMLRKFPEWRGRVSLVQISVPSREDITHYAEQRTLVENAVGRINGEFGDGRWVPVRYLYRAYGRDLLAQFYRAAAVGYVTPLRDGMNLVAKEYVAAQNPDDPGVLLLSRFAGAAAELVDAVLTNPWHTGAMAEDLDLALRMAPEERRERHRRLLAAVERTTAVTWARDFLAALDETGRDADRPTCTSPRSQ